MRVKFVVVLSAVVMTAGCLSATSNHSDPGSDMAIPPNFEFTNIDLTGTPSSIQSNETWSRLEIQAKGEPGSWMVVYRELPAVEPSGLEVHLDFEARAAGDGEAPLGLFTVSPQIVTGNGTASIVNPRDARLTIDRDGREVERQVDTTIEWRILGGNGIVGIIAVIGSTGAWEANITVTLDNDGDVTGPSFVAAGADATLARTKERMEVLPSGIAGSSEMSMELEQPGWTHLEFDWEPGSLPLWHMHVRNCTFDLGEWERDCTNRVATPDHPGGTNIHGQFPNGPATAEVKMDYVSNTNLFDAWIIHLPGRDRMVPDGVNTIHYSNEKVSFFED